MNRPRIADRPVCGPITRRHANRCTRSDPHRCELGRHMDAPEPVPGWRDLGAYLAGTGPRPELPYPFVHCADCHGWHGVGVSHR